MIDLLIFLIFVSIIVAFLITDRKKITFSGLIFMRKTLRGKAFIEKTAKRTPRLWEFVAILAVIVGIGAMIFTSYYLINCTYGMTLGHGSCFKLVLPGPSHEAGGIPGMPMDKSPTLFLPWYFWVIGIATVMVPHEFFHGIMCRLKGIRVKYLGWVIFIFLPGAFVEPDQKQLNRACTSTKLKIYAAGSFANFLMAGLFLILMLALSFALVNPGTQFNPMSGYGYPAEISNLSGIIININGTLVSTYEEIGTVLMSIPVGSNISITTSDGIYYLSTIQHPDLNESRSFIGITPYTDPIGDFVIQLFWWIFVINLGIGLFNLLPIKPLDGGLIFEAILRKFTRHARKITIVLSLIFAAMIITNIVLPMFL
ncbi:MAG: site-2 protease family protein [Candidatus Aenigmatarchaeota archaeon]